MCTLIRYPNALLKVVALFLLTSVRCEQSSFATNYEVDTVAFMHESNLQRFSVVSISVLFAPGKCARLSHKSNPSNTTTRTWCPVKDRDFTINSEQGKAQILRHPLAGVFRLVCGVDVWESHYDTWWKSSQNSTDTDWQWPHQIFFLGNRSQHLTAHPALAFVPARKRAHAGQLLVELAIVLHEGEFVGKHGVTPLANVLLRPRTLRHLEKQECSLQVLPPSSQSIRPSRRFTIGDRVVEGSATLLSSASDADPTPKQWLRRKRRMRDWVATKREKGEHVPAIYGDIFTEDPKHKDCIEVMHMRELDKYPDLRFFEMAVNADGGIFDPLEDSLKDVTEGLGGPFADGIKSIVSANAGPQIGSNLIAEANNLIGDLLTAETVEGLARPLMIRLKLALTEAAGEAVQQILSPALTKHYNKTLPHIITADVVQRMPELTNRVSVYLARLLLEDAGRILPRALTHAVVPALIHTITHSPLEDYYCFYCYKYKLYCNYCQLSPVQVYFASYYASFYSSYYTDYYIEYYGRLLDVIETDAKPDLSGAILGLRTKEDEKKDK